MSVEERVRDLEVLARRLRAENARLKGIGGLVLAALAVVLLTGQGKPDGKVLSADEVTARSIVIRDAAGKKRAWLGVGEEGTAGLRLFDPAEDERAGLLTEAKGGAGLYLWGDGNGKRQTVTLHVGDDNRAFFRIFAQDGHLLLHMLGGKTLNMAIGNDLGPGQMWVRTTEAGGASLTFEKSGQVLWEAPGK